MSASGVVSRPFGSTARVHAPRFVSVIERNIVFLVADFCISAVATFVGTRSHDVRAPDVVLNEYYLGETERKQIYGNSVERGEKRERNLVCKLGGV